MRYTPTLLLLLTLAAVVNPCASEEAVTLIAGGQEVFLHTPALLAGGEVYLPLTALSVVGAKFDTDEKHKADGQKVKITASSGKSFTRNAKLLRGNLMVPIMEIAPELGAVAIWEEKSRTLRLRAHLEQIELTHSELKANTSYPVSFEDSVWVSASKLILDLHGVHLPEKESDVKIKNATRIPVRLGTREGETVRIVLDLSGEVKYRVKSARKTSRVVLSLTDPKPGESPPTIAPGPTDPSKTPPTIRPVEPPPPPATIGKVDYRKAARRAEVEIETDKTVKFETSMTREPDRVTVDIWNSVLDDKPRQITVGHELLRGIHVEQRPGPSVRVSMDLARVAGFDVKSDSPGKLTVNLEFPKGAGGHLAGKTVVIDPGHGGSDTGAVGIGGWREKDSNLSMALRVQRRLSEAGAVCLLTRSTDVRLGNTSKEDLDGRASFARRHSADFFVSIHSNSVAGSKCPSGIETYYHGRDSNGRALAYCIHGELIRACRMPDLKVKSDFVLYQTGLGVLRGTSGCGIPAALLEIGFVKNASDIEKIKSPEFQETVAAAVVKGLKCYIEGNPGSTRAKSDPDPEPTREQPESRRPTAEPEPSAPCVENTTKPEPPKPAPTVTTGPKRPGVR